MHVICLAITLSADYSDSACFFFCRRHLHASPSRVFVQFLSTLEANLKRVSGPVRVSIPKGGITDGSVLVQTSVVFLNGKDESAKAYKSALTSSNPSSVYGSYNAVVDPYTFQTDSTANPEQGKQDMWCVLCRRNSWHITLESSVPDQSSHKTASCRISMKT